jgi:hypothetical protein
MGEFNSYHEVAHYYKYMNGAYKSDQMCQIMGIINGLKRKTGILTSPFRKEKTCITIPFCIGLCVS